MNPKELIVKLREQINEIERLLTAPLECSDTMTVSEAATICKTILPSNANFQICLDVRYYTWDHGNPEPKWQIWDGNRHTEEANTLAAAIADLRKMHTPEPEPTPPATIQSVENALGRSEPTMPIPAISTDSNPF